MRHVDDSLGHLTLSRDLDPDQLWQHALVARRLLRQVVLDAVHGPRELLVLCRQNYTSCAAVDVLKVQPPFLPNPTMALLLEMADHVALHSILIALLPIAAAETVQVMNVLVEVGSVHQCARADEHRRRVHHAVRSLDDLQLIDRPSVPGSGLVGDHRLEETLAPNHRQRLSQWEVSRIRRRRNGGAGLPAGSRGRFAKAIIHALLSFGTRHWRTSAFPERSILSRPIIAPVIEFG